MLTAGDLRTALIPTPVKTSAYTAVPGDFVLADATSGGVPVTLPLNPPQNSVVGAKQVATAGGNTVTVKTAGADSFNLQGGPTTLTLTLLNQGVILQYSSGVWVIQSDDLPLAQLDARYGTGPEILRAPAGATAQTFPRWGAVAGAAAGTSGTLYCSSIVLPQGMPVNSITFVTDSAAKTGGTHGWYVLLDSTRKVVAVSADQTDPATVWGATFTPYPLPVLGAAGAVYSATYSGVFYVGQMVAETAGTMPTFAGAANNVRPGAQAIPPIWGGASSAGQTTPPAIGAVMSALGSTPNNYYAYVS